MKATSVVPEAIPERKLQRTAHHKRDDQIRNFKEPGRRGTWDLLQGQNTRTNWKYRLTAKCRHLVNNGAFSTLTTLMIVYSLFGDDFRILAVKKDFDEVFDIITMLCVVVFTTEVFAASVGLDGYFFGFFFFLDVVSTITMVADLAWVTNLWLCDRSETTPNTGNSRAKSGARASRTVRIIRLVRLVKLYKTYQSVIEKHTKKVRRPSQQTTECGPGEEEKLIDDPLSEDEVLKVEEKEQLPENDPPNDKAVHRGGKRVEETESRVGKKLSDMTTRRVIVLILVMLVVLPQFQPANNYFWPKEDFRTSASLGSSMVYKKFEMWCPRLAGSPILSCLQSLYENSTEHTPLSLELRNWYEYSMAFFVYLHHKGAFYYKLAWIGINSPAFRQAHPDRAESILSQVGQMNQRRFLGEFASDDAYSQWTTEFSPRTWDVPSSPLSAKVVGDMTSPWLESCFNHYGVPVQKDFGGGGRCSVEEELRCTEIEKVNADGDDNDEAQQLTFLFAFDKRKQAKEEAELSLFQTIFLCVAVGIGSIAFSSDADYLLLKPIQRMIVKMESIIHNPLEAMRLADMSFRDDQQSVARRKQELATNGPIMKLLARCKRKPSQPIETVIIEKSIIKLGGFLVLGFGEKDSEIVGRSLCKSSDLPGRQVSHDVAIKAQISDAIIAVVSIRGFNEVLEAFKTRSMMVLNRIAEIVHAHVDEYHGTPNSNFGDSFLAIWNLTSQPAERRRKLNDFAVAAVVKIIIAVAQSTHLNEYAHHPKLLMKVPHNMSQVKIGMHSGRVAECAIGSGHKLDVLYISRNVKIATELAVTVPSYGVDILMSHFIFGNISRAMASLFRLIDHIILPNSKRPLRIFTIDMDCRSLRSVKPGARKTIRNKAALRTLRQKFKEVKWTEAYQPADDLQNNVAFQAARKVFTADFFLRFSTAYRNYEAGQWNVARDMFVTCNYAPCRFADDFVGVTEEVWPADGPSRVLLAFMRRSGYQPPGQWHGYRRLSPHNYHDLKF